MNSGKDEETRQSKGGGGGGGLVKKGVKWLQGSSYFWVN